MTNKIFSDGIPTLTTLLQIHMVNTDHPHLVNARLRKGIDIILSVESDIGEIEPLIDWRKTLKDPNIGVNGMVCPALEEDPDTHANCITCGGKGICSREQWQHYYEALEEALQVKECSPQCGICIYPKCDECLKDTCCKDTHTELELFTLVATAYQVIEGKDLDLGNSEDGWTIPEDICDNPQALIRYLNLVCSRNGIE